jgi:hypothetical protein
MSTKPDLSFIKNNLFIRYQGSIDIQNIVISYRGHGGRGAALAVDSFVDAVNDGAAGGAEFAPWLGEASCEHGPTDSGDPRADELDVDWTLRLRAVSPAAIRNAVESIGRSGFVERLSIVGGLTPDGSGYSIDEHEVARRIENACGFPEVWPALGFSLERIDSPSAFTIEVHLENSLDNVLYSGLIECFDAWAAVVSDYPNTSDDEDDEATDYIPLQLVPTLARKKKVVLARYDSMSVPLAPAVDVLMNILGRYSHTGCRITRLVVGAPW